MNAIIETTDLRQEFNRAAVVRDFNLRVEEGSIYALLGSNGAGKTTAIKTIMNLLDPSGGSARVLGKDSRKLGPDEWHKIGYVSENQKLPEWMNLGQLIAYCRPLYPSWDQALCEKLLHDFDLPLNRKIKEFSRGMKVKAALLTALAYRPQLLVLDEPFTGLDALVRDDLVRGILELSGRENWSVLISSHDIDEIEKLADQVGFLHHGTLLLQESIEALLARFRQVEVVLNRPLEKTVAWPEHWLLPEKEERVIRFVDPHFIAPREAERAIRELIPGVASVAFSALSLRDIYLTLARVSRKKPIPHLPSHL